MTQNAPSSTALLIARSLILLSRDPSTAGIVPPGAADLCSLFLAESAQSIERGERRVRLWTSFCRSSIFRRLVYLLESLTLPGILRHYALRKKFIEAQARGFLAAHPEARVLILGAGFDTLALRLCRKYADAQFLELDHPATQNVKRSALLRRGALPANFELHQADLGASPDVPTSNRVTFIVAEGLLMYLEKNVVEDLFRNLAQSAPGSEFVFTFLEPHPTDGLTGFARKSRAIDGWLRRRSEPFQWGIRRDALADWLPALGWTQQGSVETLEALRATYLPALPRNLRPVVCGDLIATAELGR